ncbi:hypothetical protein H4R33_007045, partial [Dimargaris cristalligena]
SPKLVGPSPLTALFRLWVEANDASYDSSGSFHFASLGLSTSRDTGPAVSQLKGIDWATILNVNGGEVSLQAAVEWLGYTPLQLSRQAGEPSQLGPALNDSFQLVLDRVLTPLIWKLYHKQRHSALLLAFLDTIIHEFLANSLLDSGSLISSDDQAQGDILHAIRSHTRFFMTLAALRQDTDTLHAVKNRMNDLDKQLPIPPQILRFDNPHQLTPEKLFLEDEQEMPFGIVLQRHLACLDRTGLNEAAKYMETT